VQPPREDRDHPPDRKPPRGKEIGRAAQRMANPYRRGKHRAAVLEQKRDIGSHRRSERQEQSQDHRSAANWSPARETPRPPNPPPLRLSQTGYPRKRSRYRRTWPARSWPCSGTRAASHPRPSRCGSPASTVHESDTKPRRAPLPPGAVRPALGAFEAAESACKPASPVHDCYLELEQRIGANRAVLTISRNLCAALTTRCASSAMTRSPPPPDDRTTCRRPARASPDASDDRGQLPTN
jgi:hypothetical protein